MILKELEIHNFRNHVSFHIEEPKQLIIIIGRNATGKTNIIEAIQLVTSLDSFRNPQWDAVINNDANSANIRVEFLQNTRDIEVQLDVREGRRQYSCNGKKKNRFDLVGLIPAITFIPDDLMLIKDSADIRRKLIDDTGQQLSSTYLKLLNDYKKIVKQRNAVLKENQTERYSSSLLESWDENLVVLGALLFAHRIRLYKQYIEKSSFCFHQISENEEFSSRYRASFSGSDEESSLDDLLLMERAEIEKRLAEALVNCREDERIRGKTLVGPHRDEISFFIDGYESRRFASQGQQRSIALALKLGQLALIKEISGNHPVLLLDDVMSELDVTRREALIRTIDGQIQTIITATDLSCFNEGLLQNAQIIRLD